MRRAPHEGHEPLFFVVPTATFRVLYVLLIMSHDRRRILHFNVTTLPWQNPNWERLIGSIRRECLNHVIVFNERHLLRVLRSYSSYYHSSRTHRSLDDDCPDPRPVEPPEMGNVAAVSQVGGLHHRYTRRIAA